MKIGIIFSERDWVATEVALKIQSLAYFINLDCYISPKHIIRNNDKSYINLRKCNYILFIAHDIDVPDVITQSELNLVKDKPVIGIVKDSFDYHFDFLKVFKYSLKEDVIRYLQNEIKNIKNIPIKNKKKYHKIDTVLLLALVALIITLFIRLSKNQNK